MFDPRQTLGPITSHQAIEIDTDPPSHNAAELHLKDQPSLSSVRQKEIREMWLKYAASHTP